MVADDQSSETQLKKKEEPNSCYRRLSAPPWLLSWAEVMALGNLPGQRAVLQPIGSVTAFCPQIKGKSRGGPILPKHPRLK